MGIDLSDGKVVQEVSDEGAAIVQASMDSSRVFWLSRVEYSIRAFSPDAKEQVRRTYLNYHRWAEASSVANASACILQWNVTFAEVLPLTTISGQDPLTSDMARPPDPLIATPDGDVVFSDGHARYAHTIPLSAPATGAFSIQDSANEDGLRTIGVYRAHLLQVLYRLPKGQVR